MNIDIPKSGMAFARILMPQIGDIESFKANLKKENVPFKETKVHPKELKATQQEFNKDKVAEMMLDPNTKKSKVIISNDNYILDGHHRWIVAHNKKQKLDAIKVDLPILELMRTAKSFEDTTYKPVTECVINVIKESLSRRNYK